MSESTMTMKLGVLQAAVDRRLTQWQNDGVVQRMWEKDVTLWSSEQVPELADRLGWLDLPVTMPEKVDDFVAFAD
jgi:transaldolase/glucose-6-phosphate isomerase